MQVRDLMSSPAITVAPETKVQEIARIMREAHISGVPVIDANDALLGIITELSLIERSAPVKQPRYFAVLSGMIPVSLEEYREYREQVKLVLATNAAELMDDDPATVDPNDELGTLLAIMSEPEKTMLPVVENNRVIGVVTRTDLVRVLEALEMAIEENNIENNTEKNEG
ncbi:MAG: CBS domain-containing protein [Caldilineaceae bacterium]|nr:CBS domain-containing protein [Caldilineaceae bacterium]